MFVICNQGAGIKSADFFGSDWEGNDRFFVSCNCGTVRILWPRGRRREVEEMRPASLVILSRGDYQGKEGLEILFEDHSKNPYCLHLDTDSADLLPGDPSPSKWHVAVWMWRNARPMRVLERPAAWRAVPAIPWLRPL